MLSVLEQAFLEKRRQLYEGGTSEARSTRSIIDGTLRYFRADDEKTPQVELQQTATMLRHRLTVRSEEFPAWEGQCRDL